MRELQVQNGEDETLSATRDVLDQEKLLNAAVDFVDRYESVFEHLSRWYSFERNTPGKHHKPLNPHKPKKFLWKYFMKTIEKAQNQTYFNTVQICDISTVFSWFNSSKICYSMNHNTWLIFQLIIRRKLCLIFFPIFTGASCPWLLDLPRQFWQVLATQAFDALWGVDTHGKK